MAYLAIGLLPSRTRFWKRLPEVEFFFSWRDFPCRFPTQLFHSAAGLTAYGIEPLGDLGNAIVASVQQIASQDSEQLR
jgi:hypothetical protein